METTPVSLLKRLRQSPQASDWNTLIELCTPLLLRWSKSVGLSDTNAADLVQDVFLVMVEEMPRFEYDPNRSFRSWLKTVTLNKWRSAMRKHQLKSFGDDDEFAGALTTEGPETAFWQSEFTEMLAARAMEIIRNRFEPRTWEACRQMTIDGLSAKETADKLGLSIPAVYKAKSRVLQVLRQELEGFMD